MRLQDLAKAIRGAFPPVAGVTKADSIVAANAAWNAITEERYERALKVIAKRSPEWWEEQITGKPREKPKARRK